MENAAATAEGPAVAGNRDAARAAAADPLNQRIMRRLQEDGRLPFSTLARELDTSEATVRNRFNRLIEDGVLRVIAVVDPVALGYMPPVMIGLNVAAGHDPREVAERYTGCEEVTYVLVAAGRFDLLVEVVCADHESFRRFLFENCYGQPDLDHVEPIIGLELVKSFLKWGHP